jgi:hypothetical protein
MALVDDIIYVLEQAGVATPATNLFVGPLAVVPRQLPSGQPVLVITATPGAGPTETHNITNAPSYTNPGAQLAGHGIDYDETVALVQDAYDALYPIRNQYVGSGSVLPWYLWIRPLQEPFPIGVDAQGVIRVVFNVTARRRA